MPKPRTPPVHLPTPNAEPAPLDPQTLAALQAALLAWFATHGRDLPWRDTRDPWRVLVSEVMLQQIQVARAIPFYLAFIDRFPTVHALAAAPLADAIRVWGDLGRYRRVVNLHRTARIIVEQHGGVIPSDVAILRTLPGIGPYTAGAVVCFAFGQDTSFIDTNLRRVLHRVFVGVDVPHPAAGAAEIERIARMAVPAGRGWEWNQGLMDLGATVCTARRPACTTCPVQAWCRAHPDIRAAIAGDRRSRRPAYRYQDSHRYHRGRVLARLREQSVGDAAGAGIPLRDLGAQLRDGFGDDDLPWLRGVVESLAKDGLAVAEDEPAYDADGRGPEVRVRLPT